MCTAFRMMLHCCTRIMVRVRPDESSVPASGPHVRHRAAGHRYT